MSNQFIDELIVLLIGIIFLIIGFFKRRQRKYFFQKGIKTEGVVLRIEKRHDGLQNDDVLYYPVVRYVTKEKDWITEKYSIGLYSFAYKEGDKVSVFYQPDEPIKFIIDDTSTSLIGPLLIIMGIGVILCVIVYYFMQIPE